MVKVEKPTLIHRGRLFDEILSLNIPIERIFSDDGDKLLNQVLTLAGTLSIFV